MKDSETNTTVLAVTAFAHSHDLTERWEEVATHLRRVSARASEFAGAFGAEVEGRLMAVLHDVGKYGEPFQARLRGGPGGVDHWSVGARLALKEWGWNSWAALLAIEGHHVGIQCGWFRDLQRRLQPASNWSVSDTAVLRARLAEEGFSISDPFVPVVGTEEFKAGKNVALMLAVRMLYSALVDADFLATELHFSGTDRPLAPAIDAPLIETLVEAELLKLSERPGVEQEIRDLRREVGNCCRSASDLSPGVFTLTAPTGSGKTLALLLFASRHARIFGKRRIVVALPYLTITDQTVRAYAGVVGPWLGSVPEGSGLLEHHSLAAASGSERTVPDGIRRREQLAENWDAPIVVTTTVQLLESLFSNRSSACRKLHRLADSVVLIDEAQTLPTELAVPTLAALSHLAERFGATVVLSTATQPAFSHLHPVVSKQAALGWQPREICPPELNLFEKRKRYGIEWLAREGPIRDESLVGRVVEASKSGSVLVIANLKRQALRWLRALQGAGLARCEHLSTNMTPAHRRRVLGFWEDRRNTREPGNVLVATQCVEAGVDLDFPAVFRAIGPLDSMAQAAGRANRDGMLARGRLVVFEPTETGHAFPDGGYRQAKDEALQLLSAAGWPTDLERPELFERYYRALYGTRGTMERTSENAKKFDAALDTFDFPKIAELYHLIPRRDVINVLCLDGGEAVALAGEVKSRWLTTKWVRRARLHAVNIFRPPDGSPATQQLDSIMISAKESSGDWFILRDEKLYDKVIGLQLDANTVF